MPIINTVISGGGSPTPSTKYGATGDTFLGDTDANGVLQNATTQTDITFTGVLGIAAINASAGALFRRFQYLQSIRDVSFPDLATLTTPYAMANAFYGSSIRSFSANSLETLTAPYAFYYTFYGSSIRSFSAASLKTIGGANAFYYTFYNCTGLISVDLRNLETINASQGLQYAFSGSGLTNLDLRSLKSISKHGSSGAADGDCYYMCQNCTSLVEQKFQSLNLISNFSLSYAFSKCTSLQSVWFYALLPSGMPDASNNFYGMLSDCSNVTVHFPIKTQTKSSSITMFGTNTTVLFDLVTSLTGADSVTYTRQEKDSTATATAWNDGNDVLFYTSGVSDQTNGMNEPQVGDTIYSDAACTVAETTISAIA